MMAEPTPPPWKFEITTLGHPDNSLNLIIGAADHYIARLFSQGATIAGLTSRSPSQAEAEANARRIVVAVNHADALAAFLTEQHKTVLSWQAIPIENHDCGICEALAAYNAAKKESGRDASTDLRP